MRSIVILLLVLGYINIVSTYQCYDCANGVTEACGDPFNKKAIDPADKVDAQDGVCIKIKVEDSDKVTVTRTAVKSTQCPNGENGCQKQEKDTTTLTKCCCNSDLCNGIPSIRQQPLVIFFTTSILSILAYRWV